MDIEEAGFKYQPTDIDACFGLVGLQELDANLIYRRKLTITYIMNLTPQVELITQINGSHWLFGILAPRRDELVKWLDKHGIETNLAHLRNDIFKVFGGKRLNLPNMNYIEDKYIYLPINHKVTVKDVQFICDKINEFYRS